MPERIGSDTEESVPVDRVETEDVSPEVLENNNASRERGSDNGIRDEALSRMAEDLRRARAERSELEANSEKFNRINDTERIVETGVREPKELIDVMHTNSFENLKRIESRNPGKGAIGKFKRWLDGESSYVIGNDQKAHWNAANDIGRRALKAVFNRRTLTTAAAVTAVGLITGGLGATAWMVGGSIAGRFSAEVVDMLRGDDKIRGGTRGARKEVLLAGYERYMTMKTLATGYQEALNGGDEAGAAKILMEINDIYHRQGEAAVTQRVAGAEKSLDEREAKLDKLKGRLQTVGEIAGGGAYLYHSYLAGSFAPIDLDSYGSHFTSHTDKLGMSVHHGLQNINGQWHFLYQTAAEQELARQAGATVVQAGLHGAHTLGAGASLGQIMAYSIGERIVPVLMASGLASITGVGRGKREQSLRAAEAESRKLDHGGIAGQLAPSESRPEVETQDELEKLARSRGVYLPESPKGFEPGWYKHPHLLETAFSLNKLPLWPRLGTDNKRLLVGGREVYDGVAEVNAAKDEVVVVYKLKDGSYESKVMGLKEFILTHANPKTATGSAGREGSTGHDSTEATNSPEDERLVLALDDPERAKDIANEVCTPKQALFLRDKLKDTYYIWESIRDKGAETPGVTFDINISPSQEAKDRGVKQINYINLAKEDGGQDALRFEIFEDGSVKVHLGTRAEARGSTTKWAKSYPRMGDLLDLIREAKRRVVASYKKSAPESNPTTLENSPEPEPEPTLDLAPPVPESEPETEPHEFRFTQEEYDDNDTIIPIENIPSVQYGFINTRLPGFMTDLRDISYRNVDVVKEKITLVNRSGQEHAFELSFVESIIDHLEKS